MAGGVHGPTLPRRRIARELKLLREQNELPLEELSRQTDVSTSTLSRLENAQGSANTLTMRALVDFYNLRDTDLGQNLLRWAKDGRKQGWWQKYPDSATENTSLYVAYESQATLIKGYSNQFVPVLLQTRQYSEAMARAFHPSYTEKQVQELADFREHRQRILAVHDGQPATKLRLVVHETCLLQRVGSSTIMSEQLAKLLELVEAGSDGDDETVVHVRVLPLSAPPHSATRSTWTHFEYADDRDSDITLLETHIGLITPLDKPDEVSKSAQQFKELWALSLARDASSELLRSAKQHHAVPVGQ